MFRGCLCKRVWCMSCVWCVFCGCVCCFSRDYECVLMRLMVLPLRGGCWDFQEGVCKARQGTLCLFLVRGVVFWFCVPCRAVIGANSTEGFLLLFLVVWEFWIVWAVGKRKPPPEGLIGGFVDTVGSVGSFPFFCIWSCWFSGRCRVVVAQP